MSIKIHGMERYEVTSLWNEFHYLTTTTKLETKYMLEENIVIFIFLHFTVKFIIPLLLGLLAYIKVHFLIFLLYKECYVYLLCVVDLFECSYCLLEFIVIISKALYVCHVIVFMCFHKFLLFLKSYEQAE